MNHFIPFSSLHCPLLVWVASTSIPTFLKEYPSFILNFVPFSFPSQPCSYPHYSFYVHYFLFVSSILESSDSANVSWDVINFWGEKMMPLLITKSFKFTRESNEASSPNSSVCIQWMFVSLSFLRKSCTVRLNKTLPMGHDL